MFLGLVSVSTFKIWVQMRQPGLQHTSP